MRRWLARSITRLLPPPLEGIDPADDTNCDGATAGIRSPARPRQLTETASSTGIGALTTKPTPLYVKRPRKPRKLIGEITAAQLHQLTGFLEDGDDHEFYVDADLLAFMEEEGADEQLVALLRQHVGDGKGLDITW